MSHDALKQVGASEGYVPPQDALTEPWWDATREHRLLLQTCGSCGQRQHHPRHVCAACAATDGLGWSESSGAGSVDTFTVVHRPPRPDLEAPYVIARIRLDDGPVLLSSVVGADALGTTIGDRVRLAWRDLSDGRALPVFEREEG